MDPRQRRFEHIYTRRYRSVYAYVHRRLPSEASDITAEVFAVAWRRLDDVSGNDGDLLWLYGVAHRYVARGHRSAFRRLRLFQRLAEESQVRSAEHESDGRVAEAIERLRPADREVVKLVLWEGLSHSEAAAILECSVSAVAQRMHRARERLRDDLGAPADSVQGGQAWTSTS